MLTGKRVFNGQSVTEVLAAVLRQDPDWERLPAGTPTSIRRLLRRCLQKDRKRRLQWIGDARLEIADATDSSDADTTEGSASRSIHARGAWIGFAIVVLIAVLLGLWRIRNLSSSPPREMRVDIAVPESSDKTSLAISPDGLKIAYVTDSSEHSTVQNLRERARKARSSHAAEGTTRDAQATMVSSGWSSFPVLGGGWRR
jgi:hypothetical protein